MGKQSAIRLNGLDGVTPEFCRSFGIRLLYLFGSHSRGEDLPTSDVDFAVHFQPTVPDSQKSQLQEEVISSLMGLLGRNDVGVAILDRASALLKHRVVTEGILLFEAEPAAHAALLVKTLWEYDDTRSLRQATRSALNSW